MSKVLIVIPSRYASTRLHAKPLALIGDKPMVQWVYERASQTRGVFRTVVATDDDRIFEAVRSFGGGVVMTSPEIQSGTDRVRAVAEVIPADIYVNVQGDEPLIDASAIEAAVHLVSSGRFAMSTVMTPLREIEELSNPSVVKVLADRTGRAIYFSRLPIPYSRGEVPSDPKDWVCQRHIGLYVFKREVLEKWKDLPPSRLEKGEILEQLRALEDGISIGITQVGMTSIGVDTPEDLEKVRRILV
jgi:3-deoxy-D-manno-octulosonate cytidylyltransferase